MAWNWRQGFLEAGLILTWSSGYIGAVIASENPSVLQVIFWRFIATTLILLPVIIATVRKRPPVSWFGAQFLLGFFGVFLALTTGIFAIDLGVPAANSALIGALMPLVTAALAGPLLGDKVTPRQWLGLSLGVAGVAIAIGGGTATGSLVGYALSFVSMGSTVIATILAKRLWKEADLVSGFGIQAAVTTLLVAPLALWEGQIGFSTEPQFLLSVAWFVILSTFGAYGFFYLCLMRTSPIRVGAVVNLTPSVTALWAWLMFGQPVTLGIIAGLAISWLGLQLTRQRAARVPATEVA